MAEIGIALTLTILVFQASAIHQTLKELIKLIKENNNENTC